MPDFTEHAPGAFCWADLATTDPAAAKAFYGKVFGWGFTDIPVGPEYTYTLLQGGGKDLAGMGPLMPEQQAQGVPPHWLVYVATADCDATVAKATELGGAVLAPPMDVPDAGRMAVLKDPQGAVFAVWQAGRHKGFGRVGENGTACWFELMTPDAAGAAAFYTSLFGWGTKASEIPGMDYTEWLALGQPAGGMMPMAGEMWQGVPPHWMLYVRVDDCDASAAAVTAAGGNVCVMPTDIPKVGRFAVVNDPQGATFSIITLAMPG